MGICFVLTGAGHLHTLARMQTNLYRGIVALGCALRQGVSLINSAAKSRLNVTILIMLGLAAFQGSLLAQLSAQEQNDLAAIQAAIEVYNSPKMTTNDLVRLLGWEYSAGGGPME